MEWPVRFAKDRVLIPDHRGLCRLWVAKSFGHYLCITLLVVNRDITKRMAVMQSQSPEVAQFTGIPGIQSHQDRHSRLGA
jgi:hypothetical protein